MGYRDFLKYFHAERDGSIASIFALSVLVLIGVTGLAVDASRAYGVSMRIASALDAAALAGGRLLELEAASDADIAAAAQAHFRLHAARKRPAGLELRSFKVVTDRSAHKVSVEVDVALPTRFAYAIGFSEFEFNRRTEVIFGASRVELATTPYIADPINDGTKLAAGAAPAIR